jgi:GntR family transcriptional regulator, transcriptional repressor for pyruvate dehydrogenase complex
MAEGQPLTAAVSTGWQRTEHHATRGLKRSELVAREIVEEIIGRRLRAGDVLPPESAMTARYGVARATLREALRLLEAQGIITLKPGPGGGPVMAPVSAKSLGRSSTLYFRLAGATYRDLIEALALMRPWLAELAAEHADPDEARARLLPAVEASEALRNDAAGIWHVGPQFHETVYELSGNPVLSTSVSSLSGIFRDHVLSRIDLTGVRDEFLDDHRRIAQAIIARQPKLAYGLSRANVMRLNEICEEQVADLLRSVIAWD